MAAYFINKIAKSEKLALLPLKCFIPLGFMEKAWEKLLDLGLKIIKLIKSFKK